MRAKTSETVDLSGIRAHYISVWVCSSCFEFTHRVALAIVVAWVWIEGTQLHPAKTHLILGLVKEPAYIRPGLKKRDRKKKMSVYILYAYVFLFDFLSKIIFRLFFKRKKKKNQWSRSWFSHGFYLFSQGEGVIHPPTTVTAFFKLLLRASCFWRVLEQDAARARDVVHPSLWLANNLPYREGWGVRL